MPVMTLGVVLAAGAGSRYGSPKALAENWLQRAVSALAAGGVGEVLVALGAADVPVPRPATPLWVPDWADGLSATVAAAIHAAQSKPGVEAVLLHTVDTPDVGPAVIERVLRSNAAGLTRAVYRGRPGHPVVVGRAHWHALLDELSGDVGAGPFLEAHPDLVRVECSDLASGVDIDAR